MQLALECAQDVQSAFMATTEVPDLVFEISFPFIEGERAQRKFLRNPEAFVVTALKNERVEVSWKNLSAQEEELMANAKG